MEFSVPGFIKRFCTPNALLTLTEYLIDYASDEVKEKGWKQIDKEIAKIEDPKLAESIKEKIIKIMKKELNIVVIKIADRIKEAGLVQKTLSDYNEIIKTRFGFHELSTEVCSRQALIILELAGELEQEKKLVSELNQIGGIKTEVMNFEL